MRVQPTPGRKPKSLTLELEVQLRALWRTKKSLRDICEELDTNHTNLKRWVDRLELPERDVKYVNGADRRTNHVGRIGPQNSRTIERHCIDCKKLFMSWDRVKNQRCGCRANEGVESYSVVGVRFSAR